MYYNYKGGLITWVGVKNRSPARCQYVCQRCGLQGWITRVGLSSRVVYSTRLGYSTRLWYSTRVYCKGVCYMGSELVNHLLVDVCVLLRSMRYVFRPCHAMIRSLCQVKTRSREQRNRVVNHVKAGNRVSKS